MISERELRNIVFLDIETVPQEPKWDNLSEKARELWDRKTIYQRGEEVSAEDFYNQKAGILAEFGKIICISCGVIARNHSLKIKSFYGDDEYRLLLDFLSIFNENYFQGQMKLCAHNGKEFDFPFLARRMIIQQIELPQPLRMFGKKPWEIPHLDTMELWKFGDYKHFTSLDLLAFTLGIPSPKNDMDGSMVAKVYYEENNLEKIKNYCEKDVETLANVFLRLNYLPLVSSDSSSSDNI